LPQKEVEAKTVEVSRKWLIPFLKVLIPSDLFEQAELDLDRLVCRRLVEKGRIILIIEEESIFEG